MPPLDREGLHADSPSAISTISGRRVDPLNAHPDDINIYEIAHALSRSCRYNGHVGGFLSVARHSLWVSARLKTWGHDARVQLTGLLHDASEAYVGDMVKPLKRDPSMAKFVEAEDALQGVIAQAFNLPWPMPEAIHEADRFVTVEVELGTRFRDTWNSTPEEDRHAFMSRYYDLKQEIGGE
jgi:hypothetical protein